jgi:SagB-type dehydrogenase family enzyme
MKKILMGLVLMALVGVAKVYGAETVKLPEPVIKGGAPLNEVISSRRSVREFSELPLSLAELSQLCWAAQGITDAKTGHRAAPSAVASYPLKVYVVAKEKGVTGLAGGVYLYVPKDHRLELVKKGNLYEQLVKDMPFFNKWVSKTGVTFVFTGSSTFMTNFIKETAWMYVDLEGGMAAQNLMLMAVALGLGSTPVGGFTDQKVSELMGIDRKAKTLLLVPVGKK